jgi:CHAD domain-containing protein
MKRLASEVRFLKRPDQSGVAVLDARLSQEYDSKRTAMLEALESTRDASLVDSLATFADDPPIRSKRKREASKFASLAAPRFVRAPWDKLSDAVDRLGTSPSDTALHEVRILTKRCRYAAEAVAPVVAEAGAFAKAMADVQTVLGDHHDTVVAEAWLVAAASNEPASARIAYDLVFRQRASRARLRANWPAVWDLAAAQELRTWL